MQKENAHEISYLDVNSEEIYCHDTMYNLKLDIRI